MNAIEKAASPSDEVTETDLYAALDRLDREWLADCPRYAMRVKRFWAYFPRVAEAVVATVILCGLFGGLTTAIALAGFSSPADGGFGVDRLVICAIGAGITLVLAFGGVKSIAKAAAYEKALTRYEKERLRLTTRLGLDRNHGRLDYANFDRRFGAH